MRDEEEIDLNADNKFRLTEQFDRAELVETMTGNFKTPEHFKK